MGFLFVIGIAPLHVGNIAWLAKGDALFNYVGWEVFRHAPWTMPLGLNPNYGLEFGSSIVYSDSIPLLAIFFKLISAGLPEPFQFFGLWLCLCFILQTLFGYMLGSLITEDRHLRILIGIIFLFSPVMFFRANVHLALVGHFVLLWALYLNLNKSLNWFSWPLLLLITLGIHFYLFVMVGILWSAGLLDYILNKKLSWQQFWIQLLIAVLVVTFGGWQYGYMAIALSSSSAIGYGGDQFNLLAFFNPLEWSWFVGKNIFIPPTIEGFGYIGGGAIAAVMLGSTQLFKRVTRKEFIEKTQEHLILLLVIILMLGISISNNVEIGNSHYTFTVNDHILFALNIVRASARLSWPLQYLIIFSAIWLIIKGYRKTHVLPILLLLALLQVVDTYKGWEKLHGYFRSFTGTSIKHSLTHEFWRQVPKKYSTIKLLPPQNWPDRWNTFAIYAAENKMATNSVFLARFDMRKVQEAKITTDLDMVSGKFDPKTIYVFHKWSDNLNQVPPWFDPSRDLFARINGTNVLAPGFKLCAECKQVDSSLEIDSLAPMIAIGEIIKFSKEDKGTELLLRGWSEPEPWGVWSNGPISSVAIPLTKGQPSYIELNFKGLVGPKHPISKIDISINGRYQKTIEVTKQLNNSIDITIPRHLRGDKFIVVEFKYLNPVSPKNAGYGNQDDRLLTLGIQSLKLMK